MGKYRLRPGRFLMAIVIIICALSTIAWGTWNALAWVKDAALQRLLDVENLTVEQINKTASVTGYVIRDEQTVQSPASGTLHLLAQDGERVRAGAPVAQIQGVSEQTVWSPEAGVFCTQVDGLENLLVPGTIDALDMEAVESIEYKKETFRNEIDGGELIGKVVDNLAPVIFYVKLAGLDEFSTESFIKGATVCLILNGREYKGKAVEVRQNRTMLSLFIEIEDYPTEMLHSRKLQAEIVTRQLKGWLVPQNTLVFKEGRPGIYVVSKQMVSFLPVAVKGRLEGMVLLEGDGLGDGVRYVRNPDWAREGIRLGG